MVTPIDPLQALILDVDGTTLDTFANQHKWFSQASKMFGGNPMMPPYDAAYRTAYNSAYNADGMPGLYTLHGIDFKSQRDPIWEAYIAFNNTHVAPPIPGMDAAIKEIHARSRVSRERNRALRIAVNTTKLWINIDEALLACGILPLLDSRVTKDNVQDYATDGAARRENIGFDDYDALRKIVPEETVKNIEKPGSLMSLLTTHLLGVDPASIVALEDSASGIKAYHNVLFPDRRRDIYVVGVTWGYETREELMEGRPDALIDKPQQLVELLGDYGAYK